MQRCSSGLAASSSGRGMCSSALQPRLAAPTPGPVLHFLRPAAPARQLHTNSQHTGSSSRHRHAEATGGSSGSGSTIGQDAERFARDAQKRAAAFAEEQRLQERATKAAADVKAQLAEAFQTAKANASRTYMKLDSEYEISNRAARAQRLAAEAATDLDQSFSLRRRLRNALTHVQRMWPVWQRQLNELGTTWYGKLLIFGAIVLVLSTPLFWRVLNVGLVLWWLALPLSLVAMEAARRKQAEELAAREAAETKRAAQSPLSDLFRAFAGGGRAAGAGGRGGARPAAGRAAKGGSAKGEQPGGPIIDAEWVPVDRP